MDEEMIKSFAENQRRKSTLLIDVIKEAAERLEDILKDSPMVIAYTGMNLKNDDGEVLRKERIDETLRPTEDLTCLTGRTAGEIDYQKYISELCMMRKSAEPDSPMRVRSAEARIKKRVIEELMETVLLLEKNEMEAASEKLDKLSELCCFINKKGQH